MANGSRQLAADQGEMLLIEITKVVSRHALRQRQAEWSWISCEAKRKA